MPGDTENTTAPPDLRSPTSPPPAAGDVRALVLVWSPHEPWRVGEVALLDDSNAWLIGRGLDDGAHPRIELTRTRPGSATPTGKLRGDRLSRNQMRLLLRDDDFEVINEAQLPLVVNGRHVARALLRPGDVFGPDDHYLFLYTTRPRELVPTDYPAAAFGETDAHGILGESAAAWKLRAAIALAAKSPRHAILFGASGTGKELAAHAIHALSRRARGPFVARNAATLPDGLVEAELFGNIKSFPNPGVPERRGLVGEADGGTLFLDEIGELPEALQSRLLRLLDNGEYHRLGDAKVRRADVRVIGATNRNLSEMKHDVAARLTTRIALPALSARREDIPLLVRHLVLRHAAETPEIAQRFIRDDGGKWSVRVDGDVVTTLVRREYTTNVREIDRLLWDAMCATTSDTIGMTDELQTAPAPRTTAPHRARVEPDPDAPPIEDVVAGVGAVPTAATIREQLDRNRWAIAKTAAALGMDRFKLNRLMNKYGIKSS